MKKLIIISAIALSGLIYGTADAQVRRDGDFHRNPYNYYNSGYARNEHGGYNRRFENRDRESDYRSRDFGDRENRFRYERRARERYYERNHRFDNREMRRF